MSYVHDSRKPGRKADPNSNSGKLRAFFAENPDEELTPADIAAKLGIPQNRIYNITRKLVADGICESMWIVRKKRS